MSRLLMLFLASLLCCCKTDSKQVQTNPIPEWIPLWNGKDLEGWHTYLGTPYRKETDSLGKPLAPFGKDHDPMEVIKVVAEQGGKAIRISGVAWGMMYTEKDFKNYHLKLKVKWGKAMHPPREKGPRDSGLLYHGFGVPGAVNSWMNSQELQIQQGDMGDYWPVGDVAISIPSVPKDSVYYRYSQDGALRTYYYARTVGSAVADSLAKRRVYKAFDAERPHGEWNDVELIALGDSSIHVVNGEVVMRLFNSRKMATGEKLDAGKIILQSEGAEVFYKDLFLKRISRIPETFR